MSASKGQAGWERTRVLLMEVVCHIRGAVLRKPEVLQAEGRVVLALLFGPGVADL